MCIILLSATPHFHDLLGEENIYSICVFNWEIPKGQMVARKTIIHNNLTYTFSLKLQCFASLIPMVLVFLSCRVSFVSVFHICVLVFQISGTCMICVRSKVFNYYIPWKVSGHEGSHLANWRDTDSSFLIQNTEMVCFLAEFGGSSSPPN